MFSFVSEMGYKVQAGRPLTVASTSKTETVNNYTFLIQNVGTSDVHMNTEKGKDATANDFILKAGESSIPMKGEVLNYIGTAGGQLKLIPLGVM